MSSILEKYVEYLKQLEGIERNDNYVSANKRYERKFAVNNYSRERVEQLLRVHPAAFRELYPQRHINNIYLDTPALAFFYDNVNGATYRSKARIRWYDNLMGYIPKPTLEIKLKTGASGDKLSFRLQPFTLDENFTIETLRQSFDKSDLPLHIRELLHHLEPQLINRYRRKYFRSADRRFRVTIDDNLEYYQIARHGNRFGRQASDSHLIVELKYEIVHDLDASRISTYFPFRLTKSSKYVNGIEKFHVVNE